MYREVRSLILMILVVLPQLSFGEERPFFDLELIREPERARATFFPALGSLVIPGLDQFIEGQTRSGLAYFGSAMTANVLALNIEAPEESLSIAEWDGQMSDALKLKTWASQVYQTAGSLSAYHSFRTAVRSHQTAGGYGFLKTEERPDELMMAPFDFSLLARPTTFVPLGILTVVASTLTSSSSNYKLSDTLFTAGISYNAGVGEEALFRGWIMPLMMEGMGSPFWSNTFSATLFSLAHVSKDLPTPTPQFVIGWYLGWLVQKNDWSLRESIFIHAWWDVIVLTATFLADPNTNKDMVVQLPMIRF